MLYSPQVAENNNMRKIIKNTNKCKQRANTDVNYCLYIMHFSWTKTPFPGQSECFVAVLLTWLYLIRIDDASYLNGYCSLMFLCMFFNVFYKSEKHVFYVFYLQINVFNIYASSGFININASVRNPWKSHGKVGLESGHCATNILVLNFVCILLQYLTSLSLSKVTATSVYFFVGVTIINEQQGLHLWVFVDKL